MNKRYTGFFKDTPELGIILYGGGLKYVLKKPRLRSDQICRSNKVLSYMWFKPIMLIEGE